MKSFVLGLAAVLATAAVPALAATYSFTGSVSRINDGSNIDLPGGFGGFMIGDAVSGRFTYDETLVNNPSTGASVTYSGVVSEFNLTIGGVGFSLAAPSGDVSVSDNYMAGSAAPFRDTFIVSQGAAGVLGPNVGGLQPTRIQFGIGTTDTSILSSTSNPTSGELISLFFGDQLNGNVSFLSLSDGTDIRFGFDDGSFSVVPLPAGLPLLTAGLFVLGFVGRKRRLAA